MIKRLLKIPLYVLWLLLGFTVVIPVLYWVVTGEDYSDIQDLISNF